MKSYRFWLWAAVVLQFLTAGIHAITLFVSPEPEDETERVLHELFTTYQKDLGGGFHRTLWDIFTALSSCYSFLLLLGALVLAYLLRKKVGVEILRGITLIELIVFGAVLVVCAVFTFLPPIILTGLIVVTLLIGYVLVRLGSPRGPGESKSKS
jgi:hypothetical protein